MSSSSTWTWGGGGWEGQSLDDVPELSRAHADVMALLPGSSDWPFWVTDALMSGAHTSNCKWNAQCQCQFKCWFHGSRFHEVTKLYWWDSKHSTPQHQYNQTTQLHMWPRSATSENVVPEEETACRQFFDSVLLAGQRRDYVHHGSELHGLGSVRVQLEDGVARWDQGSNFPNNRWRGQASGLPPFPQFWYFMLSLTAESPTLVHPLCKLMICHGAVGCVSSTRIGGIWMGSMALLGENS